MSITNDAKLSEFAKNPKDTGSSAVQIESLSQRIQLLTEHLKENKKDFSARRGLISIVNKRKKMLKYLHRNDKLMFHKVIEKLGLKVKF